MAVAIRIPAPDPTTEEVRFVRWLKDKGQAVSTGEPLFEVETDKGVLEVESVLSGVLLKIMVEAGQTMPVGAVLALMGQAGESV